MADLIFSRRYNNAPLSLENIRQMAPAAFADTQADHLSDKYGQVTTANAIEILADFGFQPTQAAQVRSRKSENVAHAPHLLAFSKPGGDLVGDTSPEIILYNSHDGTSSLKLFAGCYRMVCSNGIIAGDGFDARLRHTQTTVAGFEGLIKETAGMLPDLMGRIDRMTHKKVSAADALDFAYNAALQRWDMLPEDASPETATGLYVTEDTAQSLLRPVRRGDVETDAWTVYNRVQEKIIRGGVRLARYTDKAGRGLRYKTPQLRHRNSRAIGSIKSAVTANRELWNLATEKGVAA